MAESPPDVTLTAGVSGTTRPAEDVVADLAPGAQIGKYRLNRVLGAGGMGVVWAAHDPDLDREVALKLLRAGDAAPARRARLLREARAMAKVHHPNVITVHEVGTADGRDFVAMEIVHGRTAAQWLAAGKHSAADVRRVFTAAGRGLAAAHAAGLVHRDFKPHNVLVDEDDRVVVTDFGLARAATDGIAPDVDAPVMRPTPRVSGLEQTVDAHSSGASATATTTPRDLAMLDAALTEAGALLGTPAYMAPEQFDGAVAGARADQFSFCVALWEAWCGERPFKGGNVLELRAAIDRGPVGGGALPRRVRAALRRGLEADPARRWPDMPQLLRAIERAKRRPGWIAFVAADAVVATAVIAYFAWPRHDTRSQVPACRNPDALAHNLPTFARAQMSPLTSAAFDTFAGDYSSALDAACQAGDAGAERVTCLAGEAKLAGIVIGGGEVASHDYSVAPDLFSFLPSVIDCYAQPPPSLPHDESPEGVGEELLRTQAATITLRAGASDTKTLVADADDVLARARKNGSCVAIGEAELARAEALSATYEVAAAADAFAEAGATADACHDDHARAAAAIGQLMVAIGSELDHDRIHALRAAAASAVDRAGKDPLHTADLEIADADEAWVEGRLDDAIAHAEKALDVFERRRAIGGATQATRVLDDTLVLRGGAGALAQAEQLTARVEQLAEKTLGPDDQRTIGMMRAQMMLAWKRGDHATVASLRQRVAARPLPSQPIMGSAPLSGKVVDVQGAPVADAQIVAGVVAVGDDSSLDLTAGGESHLGTVRTATTGADGGFTIDDVPPGAWVVAQAPDGRRSLPVPGAEAGALRVGPTSRVTGKVDLDGRPATSVVIDAVPAGPRPSLWSQQAPIADDGTFTIDHLAYGRWAIRIRNELGFSFGAVATDVDVDKPEIGPISLTLSRGHASVDVVVRADRDTTIPLAQITALPGKADPHTLDQLLATARSGSAVQNVLAQRASRTDERVGDVRLERGDLHGTVKGLAPGETTVCVIPLGSDTSEPSGYAAMYTRGAEIEVFCRAITLPDGGTPPSMLFTVPPMKRFP